MIGKQHFTKQDQSTHLTNYLSNTSNKQGYHFVQNYIKFGSMLPSGVTWFKVTALHANKKSVVVSEIAAPPCGTLWYYINAAPPCGTS